MVSFNNHRIFGFGCSVLDVRSFTLLFLIFALLTSNSSEAKTFFETNKQQPSGYFNNDNIRQERIDNSKQLPTTHYSRKHKLVSDFFNSDNDQLATHTEWENEKVLRIGIIKRRFNKTEYITHACDVVAASGLHSQEITIRMIYLPSLIATNQLNVLLEQSCHQA